MKLLLNQGNNVTEAAVMVGYNNISAFSQQFHRKFGVKPSEVKKYINNPSCDNLFRMEAV